MRHESYGRRTTDFAVCERALSRPDCRGRRLKDFGVLMRAASLSIRRGPRCWAHERVEYKELREGRESLAQRNK
jgi:hypothetical protein